MAEQLIIGGLSSDDVYVAPAGVADTVFALDGSALREGLGRPRKRWLGYADDAHRQKTQIGREYALFAEEANIQRVTQLVIRPPDSIVNLTDFAAWHKRYASALGEMLRYARKTRAPNFLWDLISSEICNVRQDGWLFDVHFHLITRGCDESELYELQKYFTSRGWRFWFSYDVKSEPDHPIALAQYISKNLASAVENSANWSPTALAELRRQTRGIALTRAAGNFRKWKSNVSKAGLTVVDGNDGAIRYAKRKVVKSRLQRKLSGTVSVAALRLCIHDYGDGVLRRSIRVRGNENVCFSEILAAYNLSPFILDNTAIPELAQKINDDRTKNMKAKHQ